VSTPSLDKLLTEIESLAYEDLKARYEEVFNRPAPPRLGRDLMHRILAYQVQAERFGGLSRKPKKALLTESAPRTRVASRKLEPGLQLVREWQGQMHIVDVLEGGFRWRGERFTSLSAIAREITGTRWSGPRFFGLNSNGNR